MSQTIVQMYYPIHKLRFLSSSSVCVCVWIIMGYKARVVLPSWRSKSLRWQSVLSGFSRRGTQLHFLDPFFSDRISPTAEYLTHFPPRMTNSFSQSCGKLVQHICWHIWVKVCHSTDQTDIKLGKHPKITAFKIKAMQSSCTYEAVLGFLNKINTV